MSNITVSPELCQIDIADHYEARGLVNEVNVSEFFFFVSALSHLCMYISNAPDQTIVLTEAP